MESSPESVVHAFLRAVNRQDVDALMACLAPNHRLVDSLGKTVEGQAALRMGWAACFRMMPDYSIAVEETYPAESAIVLLGVAQGTYSAGGSPLPENRWQTPLAVRALVQEGLITEWRIYADNEPLRRLMAKPA